MVDFFLVTRGWGEVSAGDVGVWNGEGKEYLSRLCHLVCSQRENGDVQQGSDGR